MLVTKNIKDFSFKGDTFVCTDLHFGRKQFTRSKTTDTLNYLYTSIIESACENILILGDIWDHRKVIDWAIFNEVNAFFTKLQDKKIVILVGNHDCYYRNTIQENSLSYLHKMFQNIFVVQETTFLDINGNNFLCVPWIVSEDDKNNPSEKTIKKADWVVGHFEFVNFEVLPGVNATDGFSASKFKNKPLLSGHYHIASTNSNIKYLGVCQQMSWSDYNTKKGHYILKHIEGKNIELVFVENTISERYIKIFIRSLDHLPIRVEGLWKENGDVNVLCLKDYEDLCDSLEITNYNIKIFLEENKQKIVTQNFLIKLDMNQIPYVLIDNTPEHNLLIETDDEQQNESVSDMLLKLLDNSDQGLFKEIYSEALILDEA